RGALNVHVENEPLTAQRPVLILFVDRVRSGRVLFQDRIVEGSGFAAATPTMVLAAAARTAEFCERHGLKLDAFGWGKHERYPDCNRKQLNEHGTSQRKIEWFQ